MRGCCKTSVFSSSEAEASKLLITVICLAEGRGARILKSVKEQDIYQAATIYIEIFLLSLTLCQQKKKKIYLLYNFFCFSSLFHTS